MNPRSTTAFETLLSLLSANKILILQADQHLRSLEPFLLHDLLSYLKVDDAYIFKAVLDPYAKYHWQTCKLLANRGTVIENFNTLPFSKAAFETYQREKMPVRSKALEDFQKFILFNSTEQRTTNLNYNQNRKQIVTHNSALLEDFLNYFDLTDDFATCLKRGSYPVFATFITPPEKILSKISAQKNAADFPAYFIQQLQARLEATWKKLKDSKMPTENEEIPESITLHQNIKNLLARKLDFSEASTYLPHDCWLEKMILDYKERRYGSRADYAKSVEEEGVIIGVAEIQGSREQQEDCIQTSIQAAKEFKKLSPTARTLVLKKTFDRLQQKYGQRQYLGTTCCAAVAWQEENNLHISSANSGDSALYLVVIDEKTNKVIKAERLTNLHNPDISINPEEYFRATDLAASHNKSQPTEGRLGASSGLAVSRSFGDCDSEEFGLSHEPEVDYRSEKLEPGQIAYLIIGCDGLAEVDDFSPGLLANYILENRQLSLKELAFKLVTDTFESGSTDNISAAISIIGSQPFSFLVCDGHGGDLVALEISENFYPTLGLFLTEELRQSAALALLRSSYSHSTLFQKALAPIKTNIPTHQGNNPPSPKC